MTDDRADRWQAVRHAAVRGEERDAIRRYVDDVTGDQAPPGGKFGVSLSWSWGRDNIPQAIRGEFVRRVEARVERLMPSILREVASEIDVETAHAVLRGARLLAIEAGLSPEGTET